MKIRSEKRIEAEYRQEEYNKLSLDQKIERVKSRPGSSTKELTKLNEMKVDIEEKKQANIKRKEDKKIGKDKRND